MGSPDGGLDGSAASDSDVLSVSLPGTAKKQFIMMTPEDKLEHFDRRAQAYEDNQEVEKLLWSLSWIKHSLIFTFAYDEAKLRFRKVLQCV